MPLLLPEDYVELGEQGITFVEDASKRFLILKDFALPSGIYVQTTCDLLVVIPSNYNHDGIDMLWTFPRLSRANGAAIPATSGPNENGHTHDGKTFCRWSRHWNEPAVAWKPGKDKVCTILHRITWALGHPDTQ